MKSYIIEGGKRLSGIVNISGSKNSSLPILAATILGEGNMRLYNIPSISDVDNTIEIIKGLGGNVKRNNGKIEVNCKNINKTEIPVELMSKMRSSVIIAGALIGRFKNVKFSYPGG